MWGENSVRYFGRGTVGGRGDGGAPALRAAGAEPLIRGLLEPADVYRVVNGRRRQVNYQFG